MSAQHLIGKYEVLEEIARGGMGTIYRAWDPDLHREVALKSINADLATNKVVRERFLREARSMAQLKHDNIATIYAVEPNQGTPFMVMEYYTGGNLSNRLQSGSGLPLHRAVNIVHQIAMALACAHDRGVIHRDIKPGNVLFEAGDKVKLTDFGIAAARNADASLTQVGQVLGTPLYMAPEQSTGKALDERTDLYSLGLMFYEMVTGSHPRREIDQEKIPEMLAQEEKTIELSFGPSISPDVQAIIKNLVRYRHVDRTKDSHQLIRQLESLPFGPRPTRPTSPNVRDIDDKTRYELPTSPDLSTPSGKNQVKRPETNLEPGITPQPTAGSGTTRMALAGGLAILLVVGGYFLTKSPQGKSGVEQEQKAPPVEHRLDPSDARLIDQRLSDFKEALIQKDLKTLDMISVMVGSRRGWVEELFQNYKTIEASLGKLETTPNEVSTVLRIDKLSRLNGDPFIPDSGSSLRTIKLTISHEDEGWGKIHW